MKIKTNKPAKRDFLMLAAFDLIRQLSDYYLAAYVDASR